MLFEAATGADSGLLTTTANILKENKQTCRQTLITEAPGPFPPAPP